MVLPSPTRHRYLPYPHFNDDDISEARNAASSLRDWKDGVARHVPPADSKVNSNDDAIDRVTVVGAFVNLTLSIVKAVVGVLC